MGTRCLTVMYETEEFGGKEIVVLYRQLDGSPKWHGKELRDFLRGFKVVNGLSADNGKSANLGGCLAAQIIAHFKVEAGGFYLYPAGTRNCGEEYIYHVKPTLRTGKVKIEVEEVG